MQKVVAVGGAARLMAIFGLVKICGATFLPLPLSILLTFGGASTLLVAVLMSRQRHAWIIGKDVARGSLRWHSYLLFWSLHLTSRSYMRLTGLLYRRGELPASEVHPGWYVGGWRSYELPVRWAAVVDMTCEMPEYVVVDRRDYLCLPTWDGTSPSRLQIDTAISFLRLRCAKGPVLVHCAYGHSRSVTVLCAALVDAGIAASWREALAMVTAKRPTARLNKAMMAVLDEWEATHPRPAIAQQR